MHALANMMLVLAGSLPYVVDATLLLRKQAVFQKPTAVCTNGDGYTRSGNRCFKVYSTGSSWPDAKKACEAEGAEIAKISSEAQNTLVRSLSQFKHIWIGVHEIGRRENDYVWWDGSPMTYTNRERGQPGNDFGTDEECVYVGYTGPKDDKWHDSPCTW